MVAYYFEAGPLDWGDPNSSIAIWVADCSDTMPQVRVLRTNYPQATTTCWHREKSLNRLHSALRHTYTRQKR